MISHEGKNDSAAWPEELEELRQKLFAKSYHAYLRQMRSAFPELGIAETDFNPPPFRNQEKREEWPEAFAQWTHGQQVAAGKSPSASRADWEEKSRNRFLYFPQGLKTALFTTIEELPTPASRPPRGGYKISEVELPSHWPSAHTLDVAKYVSALFPEELQEFVRRQGASLSLHDSDFADAFEVERQRGYQRAFAFRGDRGEVRGRAFLALSEEANPRYRFVAYQVRGHESPKFYQEALGPFFPAPASIVAHHSPAPISVFPDPQPAPLLEAEDLVIIGYQNALGRELKGPRFHGGWRREHLTKDGIEVDRFVHAPSGQKILSVRSMYGDEIVEMLEFLWQRGGRRFAYLGSCGALDPGLAVGDLLIPTEFLDGDGNWTSFANDGEALEIAAEGAPRIFYRTRHGTVATLIEETRERMMGLLNSGAQAVDIEARHFASFFTGRAAEASIILAVTDLPLGTTKLDAGYEINYAAVKSIGHVFPFLLGRQTASAGEAE